MTLPLGAVQLAVVSFIVGPMAIIAVALRLWSRYLQGRKLAANDYLALVALVLAESALSVFLAAGFAAGLGVHLDELLATAPQKFALHMKLFVPAQLLWAAANSCVKASILYLYIDLFPSKVFCRLCYGTLFTTAAYFTMVLLETFALCKPVQYNWDKSIEGHCTGENIAYLVAGIVNLTIDTFIVILPMPLVFNLQLILSKKIAVSAMFSLGVFCTLHGAKGSSNSGGVYSSRSSRKLNGKVKGNLTRDFERLDDELALHEVHINSHSIVGLISSDHKSSSPSLP
ncbi:uncharacterized protein BO87DRAFT_401406 [Aspergillus neoniger CBS 115656]|uniref:Rhodopsin domain-containing protein n=1 Tax=Aspergillus neoniger (strain CBS 115656) TaxID=1448310 RepID=A0A318Y9J5_ASPNB|nr:hypothetical protein BO87DRAFT_401406 [Aspergillus neoniger CBS 115656]PYH29350.1 hypothetical protein BO87DRAFT_401406 [Aspergillus neoniger CBS 115656]